MLESDEMTGDNMAEYGSDLIVDHAQEPGHQVRGPEPRSELSGHSRFAGELQPQHEPGDDRVLPRGDRGGRGPWLRQGHGRAHGRHRARRGGSPARFHGHLQRLVRQGAGAGAGGHRAHGHHQAAALDRLDPHRAGAGQLRARHRQAGRPAHEPGRPVQLHPAGLPGGHDRAQGAGLPVLRSRPAGVTAAGGHGPVHAVARPFSPARGAPGRAGAPSRRPRRGCAVRRTR